MQVHFLTALNYCYHGNKKKVSRYTPWWCMGERRYSSYSFLTSATRWWWVVSVTPRPRFTPGERTPGTNYIGGWVGLRAGLDAGARRKILCPCRGSNLDHQGQMHRFSHEPHQSKPLRRASSLFPSKTTRVLDSRYFFTELLSWSRIGGTSVEHQTCKVTLRTVAQWMMHPGNRFIGFTLFVSRTRRPI
jgi:hypothetical protein